MPAYEQILSRLAQVDERLKGLGTPVKAKEVVNPIPLPDDAYVAQYVTELVLDGQEFEKSYFRRTDHIRPRIPSKQKLDLERWRRGCESLTKGRNFDLWGDRPKEWMAERVDGEIPRSMTVIRDHITANWHEIELNPNVKGLADIFDQERKKMGWKDWIEMYVAAAQTYGVATNEICVDYHLNADGQVKNVVRLPGEVIRTPESKSFSKSDGCSYVVTIDSITDKQIEEEFADVDATKLSTVTDAKKSGYGRQIGEYQYKHTKVYPKLRAFIDDPTLVEIPFGEEQQSELIDELAQLLNGQEVEARKDQNHVMHVNAKKEAVQNLTTVPPTDDVDEAKGMQIGMAHLANIEQHAQFMEEAHAVNLGDVHGDELEQLGYRLKYPYGRYICVVGTDTIRDVPNPYERPWRELFRELHNRKTIGRCDGAGDPEIMLQEAYQADMLLSQMYDLGILQMPQKYRPWADKQLAGEDTDDNDPTRTRYTTGTVQIVAGSPPTAQLELYKISKDNAQRDRGINNIAFGGQQPSGTSGVQVQLLQNQNQTVVTGELDRNLREALEDIVEGILGVMGIIYNQERDYYIQGQQVRINVAKLIKSQPKVEITVKPGSNYPNQWEKRLAFLIDMSSKVDPATGLPIIPTEAILDHLAIQYPDFAEGGKYRVQNQALAIGMQVMKQRQAQQEAVAQEQDAITKASENYQRNQLVKGMNDNDKAEVNV